MMGILLIRVNVIPIVLQILKVGIAQEETQQHLLIALQIVQMK